jgi:formate dehydrogenase subunit gamma
MTDDLADLVHGLVEQHAANRGPLIPVLHDLQHALGYVPPEAVPLLAGELNLSRADVYGVVTFYRDFRDAPSGAIIRVCRGEACQAVGAEALADQARARLRTGFGELGIDGTTRLDHVFCLGNCALGPSVEVNGAVYGRVDADRLDTLIARAAPIRTEP